MKKKKTPYDHIRKPMPKPVQAHRDRRRKLREKIRKKEMDV